MNDVVKPIRPDIAVGDGGLSEASQHVIDGLEKLLAEAKKGRIQGIAVAFTSTSNCAKAMHGVVDIALLGVVSLLHHEIMVRLEENSMPGDDFAG